MLLILELAPEGAKLPRLVDGSLVQGTGGTRQRVRELSGKAATELTGQAGHRERAILAHATAAERSEQEERRKEDSNHHEDQRDLDRHADRESDPGRHAGTSRSQQVAVHGQLAGHGTNEWSDDQPW